VHAGGGRGLALPADVTDAQAVKQVVAQTEREFGPVALLVHNAGSAQAIGPLWDVEPDQWWRDVEVNLRGTFLCARAVLPGMLARHRGRIINMSSLFGVVLGGGAALSGCLVRSG
jgi:NAD(P)-dependent dehydrogenase (short-subunit alcohol dehydrogenase family)